MKRNATAEQIAVGVELYLPHIPSPGVIDEVWRLLTLKG